VFCPQCGSQIGDRDKFCRKCGGQVEVGDQLREPRDEQPSNNTIRDQAKVTIKKRVLLSWIFCGLACVVTIFGISKRHETTKELSNLRPSFKEALDASNRWGQHNPKGVTLFDLIKKAMSERRDLTELANDAGCERYEGADSDITTVRDWFQNSERHASLLYSMMASAIVVFVSTVIAVFLSWNALRPDKVGSRWWWIMAGISILIGVLIPYIPL